MLIQNQESFYVFPHVVILNWQVWFVYGLV